MTERRSRKGPVTAKELMDRLEQDPACVGRRAEQEKQRLQRVAENIRASAPILSELTQAGFELSMLSDLKKLIIHKDYKAYQLAIPILLRWLPRIENLDVKEEVVRLLSVPWAKPAAAPSLIQEFKKIPGQVAVPTSTRDFFLALGKEVPDYQVPSLKWAIGNALSIVADDTVFNEIMELVRDKRHGKGREMVAVALGNMKNPAAIDVLIDLLNDEEVAGHVIMALGKLKAQKARGHIERFLNHPKAWVRKEAKRALSKIDKANS